MKTIYKYQILPPGVDISMPVEAKIVAVHEQDDGVFLWAEVEPNNAYETRHFTVYATGQMIEYGHEYRGTFFMKSGLVFHLYEARHND